MEVLLNKAEAFPERVRTDTARTATGYRSFGFRYLRHVKSLV